MARSYNYDAWYNQIKDHAVDNGYPIPTKEEAEDQLCRRLSGEWCTGGGPNSFVNTRFSINDFIRGSQVVMSSVLNGEVVSAATAEERALICSRCPLNVRVPGCASCSKMANVALGFAGKGKTKHDHLLQACAICHCSNEAQVWVPAEHLAKGVTTEMMETYREMPDCWKWKAIDDVNK